MAFRFLIVTQPYRNSISYDDELFNQYKKEYEKFQRAYKNSMLALDYNRIELNEVIPEDKKQFIEYMNQDLNCQNVLSLLNGLLKEANLALRSTDLNTLAKKIKMIKEIMDVLGVKLEYNPLTEKERNVYTLWIEAKKNKDFESADKYRDILINMGVI